MLFMSGIILSENENKITNPTRHLMPPLLDSFQYLILSTHFQYHKSKVQFVVFSDGLCSFFWCFLHVCLTIDASLMDRDGSVLKNTFVVLSILFMQHCISMRRPKNMRRTLTFENKILRGTTLVFLWHPTWSLKTLPSPTCNKNLC